MEFRTGTTVSWAVPLTEPEVALTKVMPAAIPAAVPPLTVATVGLEEVQVALPVRSCVLPSVYLPMAVKG